MADAKQCVDCKQTLPLDEFYDAKGYRGGKHTCCKVCFRTRNQRSLAKKPGIAKARTAAWRAANKQHTREYIRRYRDEKLAAMTPEQLAEFRRKRAEGKRIHRAKKYGNGGRHTEAEWQLLLDLCGRKCLKCGTTENITRDHIVPLVRGGGDEIQNIQPLCRPCNSGKNQWVAIDYRAGGVVIDLTERLASVKCVRCDRPFRLTNRKRKYCSRKCGWDANNAIGNRKRSESRVLARTQKGN